MDQRTKYKTKQREILIGYLKTIPGEHFTAGDICEYFRDRGESIGQSTVYRHLEQLVSEGIINKYIFDANSPACFEYLGTDVHSDSEPCFHCKCEKCGKLIHLHCEDLVGIRSHLLTVHQFTLDPLRTVFYGICEECRKAESDESSLPGD